MQLGYRGIPAPGSTHSANRPVSTPESKASLVQHPVMSAATAEIQSAASDTCVAMNQEFGA